MSDPHAARLVVDGAREHAPKVPLVVRTHSGTEALHLRAMGSGVQAVHAEREVAIQMTRFSLRRFGVSGQEVEAIAQGLREGRGGEPGAGGPGGGAAPGMGVLERLREALRARAVRRGAGGAAEADAEEQPSRPEGGAAAFEHR